MIEPIILKKNRRSSPFENFEICLTFSLVDYRNQYFVNDDPDKIIEFYNGFRSQDQLIQWMKERPRGTAKIHEVDGIRDIIVVITTADFNGRYAKECRENIFKGLYMIFVESAEMPDPYFNNAPNIIYKSYYGLLNRKKRRVFLKMYKKFGVRYLLSPASGRFSKLFKKGYEYTELQDFGIFSSLWISKIGGKVFDEIYINSGEDPDLSLKIKLNFLRTVIINYQIGDLIGSSLGNGLLRGLRSIAGLTYLNYNWGPRIEEEIKRLN